MIKVPEGFESVFRYISVASQRAEQLMRGARPRVEATSGKPTVIALDEVAEGLVDWRVLSREELEAQQEALVAQYRSELDPDERQAREVKDVLPTMSVAAVGDVMDEEEEETRAQELERLQKIFGISMGEDEEGEEVAAPSGDDESGDQEEDEDESFDDDSDDDSDDSDDSNDDEETLDLDEDSGLDDDSEDDSDDDD